MTAFENTQLILDAQMTEHLLDDIRAGNSPMLLGEPAIGKTSVINAMNDTPGFRVFNVACNLLATREDLTGARTVPYTNDKGETFYQQAFFPHVDVDEAINFAEENPDVITIINFDEVNRANSDVVSGVMSAYTSRRLARDFPENIRLMSTGNDRGDIVPMDSAAVTRLSLYRVKPDADTWMSWMESHGKPVHWAIKDVLTTNPDLIFCKPELVAATDDDDEEQDLVLMDADDLNSMTQFTAPRTLTYLNDWMNVKGDTKLRQMFFTPSTEPNKPLLRVFVESKVGFTTFTDKLMELLAQRLNTVTTTAQVQQVPKPQATLLAQNLSQASDWSTMEQHVSTADETCVSATVLYLLTHQVTLPANTGAIIELLMTRLNGTLQGSDTQTLMQLKNQGDVLDSVVSAIPTSPSTAGLTMLLNI